MYFLGIKPKTDIPDISTILFMFLFYPCLQGYVRCSVIFAIFTLELRREFNTLAKM